MCLLGLGIYQAVLQFISYTKYVELDSLKLSKKRDHRAIQNLLKHKNIFLKRQKIFTILKDVQKDKGSPCY